MGREDGFSLIELMIVVAVMLIVAALAVPSLVRSRMAANEASAAASMRVIGTANNLYYSLYNQGYGGSLAQLGPPGGACASISSGCADLLDSTISGVSPATATPAKSGYRFTYYPANASPGPGNPNSRWALVATPLSPNSSGKSTFCTDNTNTIWKDLSGNLTDATSAGCLASWPPGGSVVGPL